VQKKRNFRSEIFVLATVLTGILSLLSLFAAAAEDEGRI
jgi:hypothetical protein